MHQNNDTSLTLSEDSDTTRVYDLNKRETSLLRTDIIKTSRFAVPANLAATPPSSPVDGALEQHYTTHIHRQLDDNVAFQQLSEIKRAIEERSASTSPVPAPLSPVLNKWFGLPKGAAPVVNPSVPRAKRIATFPFRKMEDEPSGVVATEVNAPATTAPAIPMETEEVVKDEAAIVTVISAPELPQTGVRDEPEQFVSSGRMTFRFK